MNNENIRKASRCIQGLGGSSAREPGPAVCTGCMYSQAEDASLTAGARAADSAQEQLQARMSDIIPTARKPLRCLPPQLYCRLPHV